MNENSVRDHVARALDWKDAHATFDDAVSGLAPELRGRVPDGVPWSAWQLVEHIRIAQQDLLEFARPGEYRAMDWPAEYWPSDPAPPSEAAWDASIAQVRAQTEALRRIALDPSTDLTAPTPHGNEQQTHLRNLLVAADHAAYHVGQLVLIRRLLGAWS